MCWYRSWWAFGYLVLILPFVFLRRCWLVSLVLLEEDEYLGWSLFDFCVGVGALSHKAYLAFFFVSHVSVSIDKHSIYTFFTSVHDLCLAILYILDLKRTNKKT